MLPAGVFFFALFCWPAVEVVFPPASHSATTRAVPRGAEFELSHPDFTGDLQAGKALTLSITLNGVSAGTSPIVALCESTLFKTQTVTLEPDAESSSLKGTVTLEPMPQSRTSVPQTSARIQVTFARSRNDKLQRVMRRIVYVTFGSQAASSDAIDEPPLSPEELSHGDLIIVDEVQPDVTPVSSGKLAEEDLMPLEEPEQGIAYWKHVSYLVSRSWARQVREIRRGPSSETVRVHFKLYPNGRAQLIEIEKGSGSHDINVAGIYAVTNAQPFPPFPTELGDEAVDVHVRMRTGAQKKSREVRSVGDSASGTPQMPSASRK